MKKLIISLLFLSFLGVNVFAAPSTYFVDGKSGKGTIVKVEETTTTTLKSGDIGYTDVVDMQNKIVSLINNYSDITVVTNDSRKSAITEQKTSNSDLFDDESSIEIGNLQGAELTVTSKVNLAASENSNYRRYILNLSVINSTTGALIWSSNDPAKHTQHNLSTGVSLHEQGVSLLEALGLKLSEEGKQAVSKLNINEVNRREALIKLSNAPTEVERLYYGYDAASYGATNAEIIAQNKELTTQLKLASSSGNIKDKAQTEVAVYNIYKKNLDDLDKFFTENPPYKIVYDTNLSSSVKLDGDENPIAIIKTNIIAYPTQASKQILDVFREGIKDFSDSSLVKQKYSEWPNYKNFVWGDSGNFYVQMELTDDKGNVLSSANVRLPSTSYAKRYVQTDDGGYYVWNYNWPKTPSPVVFNGINPDSITDKLVIEIVGFYYEAGYNSKIKYDLSQFQIRTKQEYIAESLEEFKTLEKENKQKGRSMLSVNLFAFPREGSDMPLGVLLSSNFRIGKFAYLGCDAGVSNFDYGEDIITDAYAAVNFGLNFNITPAFCLFTEVGLGAAIYDYPIYEDLSSVIAVAQVGFDWFYKRSFSLETGVYSRDGFSAKCGLGFDVMSGNIIPMASIGYGMMIN